MPNETPEKPKPRNREELKEYMWEHIQTKPNQKLTYYDFYLRDGESKDTVKELLEELSKEHENFVLRDKDSSYKKYVFRKIIFNISFDKGVFTFTHPERGVATFDMNTNTCTQEGKKRSTLTGYFRNHYVRGYHYYQSSKSMVEDLRELGEYGDFLVEKILSKIITYTRHDYRNLGMILPYLKKFEVMYNWSKCGVNITALTNVEPSKLAKKFRQMLIDEKITLCSQKLSIMERDVEYFKNLLTLLAEERIPNDNNYNSRNNWSSLLQSNSLYQLVKEEGYEMRPILRYLYNYIIPYEKIDAYQALNFLKDYASMHRQMEVPEFKRYPKYLKSNHDIIQGEFSSYKKEYSLELFKKNIKPEFAYEKVVHKTEHGELRKKLMFVVEVPEAPEDLKNEGKMLSHCVGSYIQRIIDGQTQILFLRKEKGTPMVTLEVRENVLIQAKGYANRGINKEEKAFIKEFAEEKKLLVRI